MCSVVGVVSTTHVNQLIFDALTVLQHRGQDAAGMLTDEAGTFHLQKSNGLVRDAIRSRHMLTLRGNMGIGHTRYPTAGSSSEAEAQPFYVNSPYGIGLAHNGNLTNAEALKAELCAKGFRHINTTSDSEVLLNVFADALQRLREPVLQPEHIFAAVKETYQRCEGAYAVVSLIAGVGLVAFRDAYGIRPLVYGRRPSPSDASVYEYMVASETVALKILGFEYVADVAPGECLFITKAGAVHRQRCAQKTQLSPCLFEFVYLARADSYIDGISVYKVRLNMGKALAQKIQREWPDHDIDVVIPVPDTGLTAAYALATELEVKFRAGLVKSPYIPRTFIMPGQELRRRSVRQKLNTIDLEFQGKNVLLVDDSIVRGTTSGEIVKLAHEAGAAKVYFASAAPPVRFPNVYGIDMPSPRELIAHNNQIEEVCAFIGADKLIYLDLDALVRVAQEGNPSIERFEDSVFTGQYLAGQVDEVYLARLDQQRNDAAKHQHSANERTCVALKNSQS